jgi:8-oxo-dGTP pyrophosphatase MutT (NUDIX family)
MGGSILPVTLHNGNVYFLFGKERNIDENPGWSDFGGGTEKGESLFQTAIREGSEELTGFLGSEKEIKQLLKKYGTFNIDYKSEGYTTYRCHIFPMEYDDLLPYYYNNNQKFLQKRLDPKVIRETKIFEKTQIKWFSFDDIKKNHNDFRSFYKNVINLILENRTAIESFVNIKLKNKGVKKNKKPKTKSQKTKSQKTKSQKTKSQKTKSQKTKSTRKNKY